MSDDLAALRLVAPVVAAERAAGREVRLTVEDRELRGDPAHARLTGGLGRGEVEAAWDVGPLLAWYAEPGGWRLEDRVSRVWVDGGAPDDDAPRPAYAERRRVGWLADQGPLDWGGLDPSCDAELARLGAPEWPAPGGSVFHLGRRRALTAAPAGGVLDRLREVLGAALPVAASGAAVDDIEAALPGWLRERCAPHWWTPQAAAERDALRDLRGRPRRAAGWRLRWTATEVARHLLPEERAWRFLGARVVDERTLDLAWIQPRAGGTLDVTRFLLDACGAEECARVPAGG
ncbi:hypothetical protein [Nocardioides pantholopis]|uniref:hypothetical protein n=1 Tax=Nocardioides pantholopis TaxID=2483798 RepID=UPI000F084AE1|nr:hypothetical protein [Nocardioides pantholopis]